MAKENDQANRSRFDDCYTIWERNLYLGLARYIVLPYGSVFGATSVGAYIAYDRTESIALGAIGGLVGLMLGSLIKEEIIARINGDYVDFIVD